MRDDVKRSVHAPGVRSEWLTYFPRRNPFQSSSRGECRLECVAPINLDSRFYATHPEEDLLAQPTDSVSMISRFRPCPAKLERPSLHSDVIPRSDGITANPHNSILRLARWQNAGWRCELHCTEPRRFDRLAVLPLAADVLPWIFVLSTRLPVHIPFIRAHNAIS